MIRRLRSKPLTLVAVLLSFVLLFALNIIAPYLPGDDLLYKLKFPAEGYIGEARILSLMDYIESCINHYTNYNYRIIPHAILQVVLLTHPFLFDGLNSIVFLLIPLVLLRPMEIRTGNKTVYYFFLLLLIWCFHPDMSWSYFWTTGSISYSWILLAQLFLLSSLILKQGEEYSFGKRELIASLLICTGTENALLALTAVFLFLMIKEYKHSKRLTDPYFVAAFSVLLLGGFIMLISPSMALRNERESFDLITLSHLIEYVSRTAYYMIRLVPVLIIFIIVGKNADSRLSVVLLLCIGVSVLSMYLAPLFEARSFVFSFMVFILLCMTGMKSISFNKYIMSFLLVVSVLFYLVRLEPLLKVGSNSLGINISMSKIPEGGTAEINRYCKGITGRNVLCDDIMEDVDHFHNKTVAAVYGYKEVRLLPEYLAVDVHEQIEDELMNNGKLMSFKKLEETADGIIVYRGLELDEPYQRYIFETDADTDIIIVRAKKNNFINYPLAVLPKILKIHFYDILETDREGLLIEGKKYFVFKDFSPEAYDRYLFAKYSKSKHRRAGSISSFSPEALITQE